MSPRHGFATVVVLLALACRLFAQPATEAPPAEEPAAEKPAAREPAPKHDLKVVYMDHSTNSEWAVFGGNYWCGLTRELLRQSLLIAARDELQLATRDRFFGDTMPSEGDNPPFNFVVTSKPAVINFRRGFSGKREVIASEPWTAPFGDDYRTLIAWSEKFSRTTCVEVLTDAGFQGQPNKIADTDTPLPNDLEAQLRTMEITAQFQAVERLHELMRKQGESDSVLGGLARAYSHLGVLTEFFWHPMHKAFRARAILYAQRLRVRDEVVGKWHREYAMALAGMHATALIDLKENDKVARKNKSTAAPPAWLALLGPFCRCELEPFDNVEKTDPNYQLAQLLRFLVIEQSDSNDQIIKAGMQTLKTLPECYRIFDSLAAHSGVGAASGASRAGADVLAETIYLRCGEINDLPPAVKALLDKQRAAKTPAGRALNPRANPEFKARAKLFAAFKASADDAPRELSWAALGQMFQEISFCQTWRTIYFLRHSLGVAPNDYIVANRPLLVGHPFRLFIDGMTWDKAEAAKHSQEFLKAVPFELIVPQAYPLWKEQWGVPDKDRDHWQNVGYLRQDIMVSDQAVIAKMRPSQDRLTEAAKRYIACSPHSTAARDLIIAWSYHEHIPQVNEWAKEEPGQPEFFYRLGWCYQFEKQYDEAIKSYERSIALAPSSGAYTQLAEVYAIKNDTEKWLATLKTLLKMPVFGLEHSSARAKIAEYYCGQRDWTNAQLYADAAAESGAAWAMIVAARVHEAQQDWAGAEEYYKAIAHRYRNEEPTWYLFCRRTGQGDLTAAHRLALPIFQNNDTPISDVTIEFWVMEGELEKALEVAEKVFNKTSDPLVGLHMALIAEQLKNTEKRDLALRLIKEKGATYTKFRGAPRTMLIAQAALFAEGFANAESPGFDLEQVRKIRAMNDEFETSNFDYFLAKYLSLRDKPVAAIEYWKMSMASTWVYGVNRSLAGFELWQRGVAPEAYKALLQKRAPAAEKPAEKPTEQPADKAPTKDDAAEPADK